MADLGIFEPEGTLYTSETYSTFFTTDGISLFDSVFGTPKTISGIIKNNDNQVTSRLIRVYRRSDGAFVGETTSNSTTGAYSINVVDSEVYVVVIDNDTSPVLNDLIARVIP